VVESSVFAPYNIGGQKPQDSVAVDTSYIKGGMSYERVGCDGVSYDKNYFGDVLVRKDYVGIEYFENIPYYPKWDKEKNANVITQFAKVLYRDERGNIEYCFRKLVEEERKIPNQEMFKKDRRSVVVTVEKWFFKNDFEYEEMKAAHRYDE